MKQRLLERISPRQGERVLELGCGRGEVLLACARRGARAVGIDYSRAAARLSRDTCGKQAAVTQADVTALPLRGCSFDKVFLGDVLEHLTCAQAEHMMDEAHRVLRPGGSLVLHTSPNVLFIRLVFPWVLLGLVLTGRLRLLAMLVSQYRTIREFHVREYSRGRLARLLHHSRFGPPRVDCDPDLLRGGQSRYTESLAESPLVRRLASWASHEPWVRLFSNDLWAEASKT